MANQLPLMKNPPRVIGCVLTEQESTTVPFLGLISDLEAIAERYRPDMALISFPAVMSELITKTRTRLRRMSLPDRFLATLEDQVAGIGPRTQLTIEPQELIGRRPHNLDEPLIEQTIKGQQVLITGAGGSIGSELARQCARYNPSSLLLMDRSENALFEIDKQIARFFPDLKRKALLHDVTESSRTLAILKTFTPDIVFHAAAHKHVPMMEDHPSHAIHNNVFGTKAILDACLESGVKRMVMISTDKAVNAVSVMGATKRLAELYVQSAANRINDSLPTQLDNRTVLRIVRFGNVLGSACSVLPIWSKQIADGGPLTVTHPDMTRYFMTIPEAASLVIQAACLPVNQQSPGGGEVFILDMGKPVRILDLARRFIELHGLVPLDDDKGFETPSGIRLVITGVRPGEKLHEQLAHSDEETCPTEHPAIRAWSGDPPENSFIDQMVHDLDAVRRCDNAEKVLSVIKRYTPNLGTPVVEPRLISTDAA